MASNFKIEVKGVKGGMGTGSRTSGIGSDVNTIRQKAIQAQKSTEKNSNVSISAMKELSNSMKALIQSNKSLIEHLKKSGGGGEGGPKGGSARSLASNAAAMFGGGFLASIIGFAASKSNMIGQAYISTAAEQSKNVGTGGFRRGQGMYTGSEIGSGMKAYAMNSGKFANGQGINKSALQVGNIYGLSTEETFGQAGKFAKAGGSYAQAANIGAGAGIETQLPMFISSIGDQLEESVAAGIDTSDMSKSISSDMAELTEATKTKDVRTAMALTNAVKGVKSTVGTKGQITNIDELLEYKATQKQILSGINQTGPKGGIAIEKMLQSGEIDSGTAERLRGIKSSGKDVTEADFRGGLSYAIQQRVQRKSDVEVQRDVAGGLLDITGNNPINATYLAQQNNSSISPQAISAEDRRRRNRANGIFDAKDIETKGEGLNASRNKNVVESDSGTAVSLINAQTNLLLEHGKAFATATVTATRTLLTLSDAVATTVENMYQMAGSFKTMVGRGAKGDWEGAMRTGQIQSINDMLNGKAGGVLFPVSIKFSPEGRKQLMAERQRLIDEDKKNAPSTPGTKK